MLEELLYKPTHSLIDQSLHSRLGVETTNGDGYGVGWYLPADGQRPGTLKGIGPAWGSRNLREVAASVRSPLFLAHIRASTGTPVQESNCHPFRFENWLWMHNGMIADYHKVKRDIMLAIDPDLFPDIEGSTDSEAMFYLALTFGLRDDPPIAIEQMAGFIEDVGHRHGVENPLQMTIATSDGERLWAVRYSSVHNSRSLFFSTDVEDLRRLHPDNPMLQGISDETRLIVSEPLGDLPGAWNAVPEAHWGVVQEGADEIHPFIPKRP
ncbi:class II glutamine amidotransferase [Rhizocola hellebori]|uniref:Class II glutamine amidotransferase n=1 Tax=Rhizocola hellebori TaxID=1392758 RepID=A0A8J3VKT4_9ACTN|nr:class II glutamine amidotransferase [Rhizocola hellebori]GIH09388.1 class II glutamine amidotransferase [Rhizocola hellebori]